MSSAIRDRTSFETSYFVAINLTITLIDKNILSLRKSVIKIVHSLGNVLVLKSMYFGRK